jgi:hypothetical protein
VAIPGCRRLSIRGAFDKKGIGHADAETLTAIYRFKAACQLTTTVMGEGSAAGLVWLMRKR